MDDLPWPLDLGYIKCAACMGGDHDRCIGTDETQPFCGCRCPWLEGGNDVEHPRDP